MIWFGLLELTAFLTLPSKTLLVREAGGMDYVFLSEPNLNCSAS